MGRPLITNRNRWNFYAMSDKNNMIKLQVFSRNHGSSYNNCMGTNNREAGTFTFYLLGEKWYRW